MKQDTDQEIFVDDLAVIRETGVEDWMSSFSVSLDGFFLENLYMRMISSYVSAMAELKPSSGLHNLCIAYSPYLKELANGAFYFSQLRALSREGVRYVNRENMIIEHEIERCKNKGGDCLKKLSRPDCLTRLKEPVRFIRANWRHVRIRQLVFPLGTGGPVFMIGDRSSKEIQAYSREQRVNPFVLRPLMHLRKATVSDSEKEKVKKFCKKFFSGVNNFNDEMSLFFNSRFISEFCFYFCELLGLLEGVLSSIGTRKGFTLLATNAGNISHRIFVAAWKTAGAKCIGFTHGNPYPFAHMPGEITNGTFLLFDEIWTPSLGEKQLLEKAAEDFASGLEARQTDIFSFENSPYRAAFEPPGPEDWPEHIKSTMVIGFSMGGMYYPHIPNYYNLTLIQLEYQLLAGLRKAGYQAVYRPHPERFEQISGIFDHMASSISTGNYEEAIESVDCLIFCAPFTTAFGDALMSSKPIVLIDNKDYHFWDRKQYNMLKKRCSILEVESDGRGHMELLGNVGSAVEEALGRMDYGIVEEYAL